MPSGIGRRLKAITGDGKEASHMIVSPPEQWYDVRRFMVQGGYSQFFEQPGWYLRESNSRWLLAAIKHMKSKPSHLDWFKQWRLLALGETEQTCGSVREEKTIGMFFETASYAYRGDFSGALRVVNKFRKAHDFTTFLPMPPPNFTVNSSYHLENGITAEEQSDEYFEWYGFGEANSTTAMANETHSTIPSNRASPRNLSSSLVTSTRVDRATFRLRNKKKNTPLKRPRQKINTIEMSRGKTQVNGEVESGMDIRHPVKGQHVQKDSVASPHKRTYQPRHTLAMEIVQGKSTDSFLEEPPTKRRRTCASHLLQPPTLPSVTEPMSQLTSQLADSESRATDTIQPRLGSTLDSQDGITSRITVDLLELPAPGPSSLFETQMASAKEPMDYDTTLDLSSSTHVPPVVGHASAANLHSTLDPHCGLASGYMDHSESSLCHSIFVSVSSEPDLDPQQTTSALFWSPSPSERAGSEDLEPDLSDSNHLIDGLHNPWGWNTDSEREPPWRALFEPPSPPNYARPPGTGDTHFWSFPPRSSTEGETVPLILPDFPPRSHEAPVVYSAVHKPCLPMAPPVWAQARQELCESLSYFRSYQGGVYTQKRRARGYLLDGHPAVQDLWHADGRCIISHAGGNSAIDRLTGQTVLIDDQTVHSASCNALLSSWKLKQAIVLIAGNGYNLFPYDLGNRSYVVLGYYWITHAWEEPEPSVASPRGYFVRWKFMFQWIQSQGRPWWIPWNSWTDRLPDPEASHLHSRACQTCLQFSQNIYNFGWVCTRSECSLFFRRVDPSALPLDASGFHPAFLTLRDDPPEFQGLTFQICPKPPVERKASGDKEHRQVTTSRHFWKGWCCEKCGRLSCREYWTHWECHNCHHIFRIKSKIQPPPAVIGKTILYPSKASGISSEVRTFNDGPSGDVLKCHSFRLPWDRGVIHLLQAEKSAQTLANSIWYQYQKDAKQPNFFRRYSMKTHKLKGRMLSHYFSQNSGEPYEYVGGTDNTVPLGKYSSVKQAMAQILRQTSLVLEKPPAFNEILSAAYMSDQKMEFHSDGEKDLGPIIASLSLGLPATMRFRPVPSRWYSDEEIVEGVIRKSPPIVLTLTLRHGDVLIMEGAKIQEYYQHAVHPWGFRIAATARYIKGQKRGVDVDEGVPQ